MLELLNQGKMIKINKNYYLERTSLIKKNKLKKQFQRKNKFKKNKSPKNKLKSNNKKWKNKKKKLLINNRKKLKLLMRNQMSYIFDFNNFVKFLKLKFI